MVNINLASIICRAEYRLYPVLLLLISVSVQADTVKLSCTSWGCNGFMESAKQWSAENPEHTVRLYEAGRLADNLLGFYRQVLNTRSNELDIFLIDTVWPGVLGKHMVDLREYVPEQQISAHFSSITRNLSDQDGRLISMPLFTDAGLLYYRKDLLDKYHFSPPETWQQLEHIATVIMEGEKQNNPNLAGFVWQGKRYEGLTCNALEWIDSYRGGTIVDHQTGDITINNALARQAMAMAQAWIGTISPKDVLNYSELETTNHFRSGNAVFMRNWMEDWHLVNDASSAVKGRVGVTAIPKGGEQGKHSGTLGDMSLAVSRYSDHVQQAAELVAFISNYQQQKYHALHYSFSPTIPELYHDPDIARSRSYMVSYKKTLLNGVSRPARVTGLAYPKVSRTFYSGVHDMLSGQAPVDTTLITLEKSLKEIRQRSGW